MWPRFTPSLNTMPFKFSLINEVPFGLSLKLFMCQEWHGIGVGMAN
jgi:hypothetical protein